MYELPDELIGVIAGDRLRVINGLRATCGRFRGILQVPPLLVNGVEQDLAEYLREKYDHRKPPIITRGDCNVSNKIFDQDIVSLGLLILTDVRASMYVIRGDAPSASFFVMYDEPGPADTYPSEWESCGKKYKWICSGLTIDGITLPYMRIDGDPNDYAVLNVGDRLVDGTFADIIEIARSVRCAKTLSVHFSTIREMDALAGECGWALVDNRE
jgi:hypothetical protein